MSFLNRSRRPQHAHRSMLCVLGSLLIATGLARGETPDPSTVATIVPTKLAPIKFEKDDADGHKAWASAVNDYMNLPADRVTAHPAAAEFPGAVPDGTPTVSRDIAAALNLPRWHSTGLYAAPGAKITIRVSAEDANRGLSVVIGAQTDSLLKLDSWLRFPKISRRFPIEHEETTVANAFGGLIYIDVPRDKALGGYQVSTYGGYGWQDEHPQNIKTVAHVHIDNAVAAPLFIAGQTTAQDWQTQLAHCKAPWGELQSGKVILTVETKHLDIAADPDALLAFWDHVIDTEAQLAGWAKQPAPQERIVLDRDISAGWMHSSYPIMAHLQSERELLKLADLQTKGNWGYFHELGHNHEAQACTFGGDYTEVNVNLYSMYVMQQLIGVKMTNHPALRDMAKVLDARLGEQKKNDAWGNLSMYVVTIQAFGWEPLQQTLASYTTPDGSKGIKGRQDKIDQWVLRYSRATKHNLSAFYTLFDLTCSDSIKSQLQSLPTWMPAEVSKYAAAPGSTTQPAMN